MGLVKYRFYPTRRWLFNKFTSLVSFILNIPRSPLVSAGAFIESDGKFLVLDLSYRYGYGFPGGMVEVDENIENAMRREVQEETGLTVTKSQYICSASARVLGNGAITIMFAVETTGLERESNEGSLHWLPPEEILANCSFSNSKEAFAYYLKHHYASTSN